MIVKDTLVCSIIYVNSEANLGFALRERSLSDHVSDFNEASHEWKIEPTRFGPTILLRHKSAVY